MKKKMNFNRKIIKKYLKRRLLNKKKLCMIKNCKFKEYKIKFHTNVLFCMMTSWPLITRNKILNKILNIKKHN